MERDLQFTNNSICAEQKGVVFNDILVGNWIA